MSYLLDHPNPNGRFFYDNRRVCQHGIQGPHLIVLHTAENLPDFDGEDTGAEAVARYASTTDRAVSWHTTVDSDSIVEMLPYSYTAFHVRSFNRCAVGMEMATKAAGWVAAATSHEEWLHGMYDNVADALTRISQATGIPMIDRREAASKWGVTTHMVLDPSRRSDPGEAFPFGWILTMAKGGFRYRGVVQSPSVPATELPSEPPPTEGVPLLAIPTILEMQDWARNKNATPLFVDLAVDAFVESTKLGVNSKLVYAIMYHETRGGHFGGVLDVSFKNWGGMKKPLGGGNFDPGAHQRFTSHRHGVRAVAQHVAWYAGMRLPLEGRVDPRYDAAAQSRIVELPDDDWRWASTEHDSNVVRYVKEM